MSRNRVEVAERQTRGVESAVGHAREGSTPSLDTRGRVAQWIERLSYKQEAAGSSPALPIHVVEAQPVERPPETRGVAGSIPADHIWLRSSTESSRLLPGDAQVRLLSEPLTEGLPQARYAVSKTAGSQDLGGSTPSPSASGGMAELERQRVATAQAATAARRFESCCLRQRPVAQRSRAVGFEPTCARSIRAGASISLRRRSTVGRPVVTRRMLVRPQPSQPRSDLAPIV